MKTCTKCKKEKALMINSAKLELEYYVVRKEKPEIDFLEE